MYLVTGDQGFIGSHVRKSLEEQGIDVYGIDLKRLNSWSYSFDDELKNVPWKSIEKIIHLGAITDTRVKDIDILQKFNVEFTKNLLDTADHFMIPIHYASSSAVYGNSETSVQPLNQYAISKLIIDYYVQTKEWNTNVVGFRLFNVYGMDERCKGDTASIVNKLIHSAQPAIFKGSVNFARDLVCIEDVVNLLQFTYKNGIYDIGPSKPTNLMDLADQICAIHGRDYSLIPMPKDLSPQYQYITRANHKNYPPQLERFRYTLIKEWLWDRRDEIRATP